MLRALLPAAYAAAASAATPPNVLILFADDLGFNQIQIPHAPYGYTGVNGTTVTPHLAQLASEGMLFMQWYSSFHVCSPSRTSMMTGRLPARVGIHTGVLTSEAVGGIPANETTLAEALRNLGYATAMFGKWHLGQREQFLPHNHGFDSYFGIPFSCDMGESAWGAKQRHDPFQSTPLPLLRAAAGGTAEVVEQPTDLSTLNQRYADFAVKFIAEQSGKKPWFLYASFNHVHQPNFANPKFCGSSKRGGIGDAVQELDDAIGQIMASVAAAGADQTTATFFTSDNGAPTSGDKEGNVPLRGYKTTTWEGGIREPAVVRWPGKVPAGAVTYELAATYDIFPTALAIAGGSSPADRQIDGKDLSPVMLHGKGSGHQCLFHWHGGDDVGGLWAVRCGDYKAHYQTGGPQGDPQPAMPSGKQDPPLLFNIRADPSETHPLLANSTEYQTQVAAIAAARDAHIATLARVCSQMKPPCGGNNYSYAICKDPDSNKTYPQWPVCTSNPEAWTAKTCV